MKQSEAALSKYVNDKHTQEECIGFIDGYKVAKEQDKAIIEELLEALNQIKNCKNRIDYHSDRMLIDFAEEVSTKAISNYLKNN